MLRAALEVNGTTYRYANEPLDYANYYWEPRLTKNFDIERFFEVSDKVGSRKRSIQISINNRDKALNTIHATYSLLNKVITLYYDSGDTVSKSFKGVITEIHSFGLDVEVTVSEELSLYLQQAVPDAQIAYDYYSDTGINDSWNALPICIGNVNRLKTIWTDKVAWRFIIGSGPLASIDKIYFNKVIMYDKNRTVAENTYKLDDESKSVRAIIWRGSGWEGVGNVETQVHPFTGQTVSSVYPGYAYVEFYDVATGDPTEPLLADGSVPEIFVDVKGISKISDANTPERNPAAFLKQLATNPITSQNNTIYAIAERGPRGFGLGIPAAKIDFDAAITYCETNQLYIDGVIAQRAEASEWFDEFAKYCMATFVEEQGVFKLIVDQAAGAVEANFDDTGLVGYEVVVGEFVEPAYDKQMNRVRLSYAYNVENAKFDRVPYGSQESPIDTNSQYLRNQDHATKLLKWNTDKYEYKYVTDDRTAHLIAQYNFKRNILQLKTVDIDVPNDIPSTLDVRSLITITSAKHAWSLKQFRITKIVKGEMGIKISCKEYDSAVYIPGWVPGDPIPERIYSSYAVPEKPELVTLTSTPEVQSDGSTKYVINATFVKPVTNCDTISLYYKTTTETEADFKFLGSTQSNNLKIVWPLGPGNYNFRAVSLSPNGPSSAKAIVTGNKHYYGQPNAETYLQILADTIAPGKPIINNVTPIISGMVFELSITGGTPSDFSYFNIYRKIGTGSWTLIGKNASHLYTDNNNTTLPYDQLISYYATAVDKTGNISIASEATTGAYTLKVKSVDITADQIVAKDIRTCLDVGDNNKAGVMFNQYGIKAYDGATNTFTLGSNGQLCMCSTTNCLSWDGCSLVIKGAITATSGSFTGSITASSGSIAGWNIDTQHMWNGYSDTGVAPRTLRLSISNANVGSGLIYTGAQTLKGFSIAGHTGGIFGWFLNVGQMATNQTTASECYGIQMMNHLHESYFSLGSNLTTGALINQIAGICFNTNSIYSSNFIAGSCGFCIGSSGSISAVSGSIGGWTLNASNISFRHVGNSIDAVISADYTNPAVYIGKCSSYAMHGRMYWNSAWRTGYGYSVTDSSETLIFAAGKTDGGILTMPDSSTVADASSFFWIGNATNYLKWNSNANELAVNGKITANSGNIGGWTLGTGCIYSCNTAWYSGEHPYMFFAEDLDGIDFLSIGRRIYAGIGEGWINATGISYSDVNRVSAFELSSRKKHIAGWNFDASKLYSGDGFGAGFNMIMSKTSGNGTFYSNLGILQGYGMTWHYSNNAGHLILGQIADTVSTIATDWKGLQMMDESGCEYFRLSAKQGANCKSVCNKIAGWNFSFDKLYANDGTAKILTSVNAGSGSSGVIIDCCGIRGYNALYGNTFDIKSDGSAPIFSSGTITLKKFELMTSGVIRTTDNALYNYSGILMNDTGFYASDCTTADPEHAKVKILTGGQFYLCSTSTNSLSWDGADLTITGAINAKSGSIGGWTLDSCFLLSGSGNDLVGINTCSDRCCAVSIWAGGDPPQSAKFRVYNNGCVHAESGNIAGWTLGPSYFQKTDCNLELALLVNTTPSLYAGFYCAYAMHGSMYWGNTWKAGWGYSMQDSSANLIFAAGKAIGGNLTMPDASIISDGSSFFWIGNSNGYTKWDGIKLSIKGDVEIISNGNLIPDPGFDGIPFNADESPLYAANCYGEWRVYGYRAMGNSKGQSRANTYAHPGSNAIRLDADLVNLYTQAYTTAIPVKGGQDYTLSAYVASHPGYSCPAAYLRIFWYDSSGTLLGNMPVLSNSQNIPSTPIRVATAGTSPATAAYGVIDFYNSNPPGESYLYFSALQLEEGSTATAWKGKTGKLTANQIYSGELTSTNWTTTTGSNINLNSGIMKLGGSASPKFHFDGTNLCIKGDVCATSGTFTGTLHTSIGDIGGWSIASNGLYTTCVGNGGTYTTSMKGYNGVDLPYIDFKFTNDTPSYFAGIGFQVTCHTCACFNIYRYDNNVWTSGFRVDTKLQFACYKGLSIISDGTISATVITGSCVCGSDGVFGCKASYGVYGRATTGVGVYGYAATSTGVYGYAECAIGVKGCSVGQCGVVGIAGTYGGVRGEAGSGYGGEFYSPFPSIYGCAGACILGCVWANAFCTISERTTKCDITLSGDVLNVIKNIPIYTYRYCDDNKKAWHHGVMADDFQKAVPWMGDGHGIPSLGSFALKGVQELDICVNDLQACINTLESRLQKLESLLN